MSLIREITPIKNIILESNRECAKGVKPLIHESSPFSRKKFLSLWSIVKTTEWNGLILKLIIEVKYIGIILSPNLVDLVVFLYLYGGFDA